MALDINGKMNKKLLHKSSKAYMVFAIFILCVFAPAFYFVTKQLYINDADEALILRKNEFLKFYAPTLKESEIPMWNRFNRDIKIKEAGTISGDTFFYTHYFDTLANEIEPYRELNATVHIEGKPYVYSARINLVETEDLIKSIALLFLVITSLLLGGLLIINKILSSILWKPFYDTLAQVEKFEIDKYKEPKFIKTNIEEFNRLNQSIEKLIKRNITIYQSQREFIENAAHELQTPLAIFQANIETLIQSGEFTKSQYNILNTLNENIARLSRINKNLLLLSKIDNEVYFEKSKINIQELVDKLFEFFSEQAITKNITIHKNIKKPIYVSANPVLTELLISNLFLNAIKHNKVGGKIILESSNHSITISNTSNFDVLQEEKLFSRFSKQNVSEHGTGLGLAIVKKIADLNKWPIKYSYENSLHSFTIFFNT